MTIEAQHTRTRQPDPGNSSDRRRGTPAGAAGSQPGDAVTIAAMRERGIATPAQVIYALQLAGYDIDRGSRPRELPAARLATACAAGHRSSMAQATAPQRTSGDEP